MSDRLTIFLDDGGVMNDNSVRGSDWQRLVGDFLAPRLGGDRRRWASANLVVAERLFDKYKETFGLDPQAAYNAYWAGDQDEWLTGMCEIVGVSAPDDSDERVRLANEAGAYVTRRVRAAYPGVVDTIRYLGSLGYALHTASGEHSYELEGYLEGMGVRGLFRRLYGPDLINTAKQSRSYYERVFADARVGPGRAVVVDDSEIAIRWASEAGATAILVSDGSNPVEGAVSAIRGLTELPALMERMERGRGGG